jgi:hypothetical protein
VAAVGAGLVGMRILVRDVEVCRVRDVLLSKPLGRVFGLCHIARGARVYFLPWLAAEIVPEGIVARSVFSLLSPTELAGYAEHSLALRDDAPRRDARRVLDVLLNSDGHVARVILAEADAPTGRASIPSSLCALSAK